MEALVDALTTLILELPKESDHERVVNVLSAVDEGVRDVVIDNLAEEALDGSDGAAIAICVLIDDYGYALRPPTKPQDVADPPQKQSAKSKPAKRAK